MRSVINEEEAKRKLYPIKTWIASRKVACYSKRNYALLLHREIKVERYFHRMTGKHTATHLNSFSPAL